MWPKSENDLSNPFEMQDKAVWITGNASGVEKAGATRRGADLVQHGPGQRAATEPMRQTMRERGRRECVGCDANQRSARRRLHQPDHEVVFPQVEKRRDIRIRRYSYVFEPFHPGSNANGRREA